MRRIAHRYTRLPLTDVEKLLASPIHEHRFVALEILVAQYERENSPAIVGFYLKHTKFVNNWDLPLRSESNQVRSSDDWIGRERALQRGGER